MALSLTSSSSLDTSNALAVDTRSLNRLKVDAGSNSPQAAREAAKQFESLFMGELLKSMRAATQASGLMDNAGTKLGTEMLDAQLATRTAGRPDAVSSARVVAPARQMTRSAPA